MGQENSLNHALKYERTLLNLTFSLSSVQNISISRVSGLFLVDFPHKRSGTGVVMAKAWFCGTFCVDLDICFGSMSIICSLLLAEAARLLFKMCWHFTESVMACILILLFYFYFTFILPGKTLRKISYLQRQSGNCQKTLLGEGKKGEKTDKTIIINVLIELCTYIRCKLII